MAVTRKKVFEVVKATQDPITALDVDGELMKFGKHGAFVTEDKGKADYIEQAFGRYGTNDVVVCEVDNAGKHYPRRVFSINAPWRKEDED